LLHFGLELFLLKKVIDYKGPERIALVSDVACNTLRPQTNKGEALRGANQLLHKHIKNFIRLK
jgi:hypothetical protein